MAVNNRAVRRRKKMASELNAEKRAGNEISCLHRPAGDFRRVLFYFLNQPISTDALLRPLFFVHRGDIDNNTRSSPPFRNSRISSFSFTSASNLRRRVGSHIFGSSTTRLVNALFLPPSSSVENTPKNTVGTWLKYRRSRA